MCKLSFTGVASMLDMKQMDWTLSKSMDTPEHEP